MAPFYPTILKSRAFTAKSLFFSHIDLWIVGVLALGLVLVLPVADAVFVACLANIVYAAAIAVSRYNLISLSKDVLGLDPHQIYYLRYSLDAVLTPEWLDKNWKTVLANYSALLADFGESLKDSKQPVAAKVIIPKTPMTQLKSRRNDGLVDQVSSSLRAVFTEEPKAPRNDIFSDSSHSRNSSAVPDILLAKSNNASCRNSKDAFHLSGKNGSSFSFVGGFSQMLSTPISVQIREKFSNFQSIIFASQSLIF